MLFDEESQSDGEEDMETEEEESDGEVCAVCRSSAGPVETWAGCDTCSRWYHMLRCISDSHQSMLDLSYELGSAWVCPECLEE